MRWFGTLMLRVEVPIEAHILFAPNGLFDIQISFK